MLSEGVFPKLVGGVWRLNRYGTLELPACSPRLPPAGKGFETAPEKTPGFGLVVAPGVPDTLGPDLGRLRRWQFIAQFQKCDHFGVARHRNCRLGNHQTIDCHGRQYS